MTLYTRMSSSSSSSSSSSPPPSPSPPSSSPSISSSSPPSSLSLSSLPSSPPSSPQSRGHRRLCFRRCRRRFLDVYVASMAAALIQIVQDEVDSGGKQAGHVLVHPGNYYGMNKGTNKYEADIKTLGLKLNFLTVYGK